MFIQGGFPLKLHINRQDGENNNLILTYNTDYITTLQALTAIIDNDIKIYKDSGKKDIELTTENNHFFLKGNNVNNEYYIE